MPYRIHLPAGAVDAAAERLIDLGALDVEPADGGAIDAVMPDGITPDQLARLLGVEDVAIAPAIGRDADSVWTLGVRPIRVGSRTLTLIDSPVFGTGLHPTTALCLEALADIVQSQSPGRVLDVGTGSGVLALAALALGVPRATAVDVDPEAVRVAAENARVNGLGARLTIVRGGPGSVDGVFPIVLANVLAAPLIEMAPVLVRRVGHYGRLVLSGIPRSMDADVVRAYRHLGMRQREIRSMAGWTAVALQATW